MRSFYIFTVAILLRFLAPSQVGPDSKDYIELAHNIQSGAFALHGVSTTFRPPLYPLFLSFLSDGTITIAQAALGAMTCVLVFWISRSLIASLLYSLAPMSIYMTGEVLSETLFTFLVVLGVYLWSKHYWAGVVFGLAALAKPIIFPMLVLGIAVSLILKWPIKGLSIMLAVTILICLPWMIRNSLIDGKITLTQRSALGSNLLYGTFTHEEFGDDIWTKALARYGTLDNEAAQVEAIQRIETHPLNYLRARVEQYPRLFINTGASISSIYFIRLLYVLIQIGIGILVIFGMRQPIQIWLTPLFLVLFHIPLWVESRYFLPAVPFCCIMAATTLRRYFPSTHLRFLSRHTGSREPQPILRQYCS